MTGSPGTAPSSLDRARTRRGRRAPHAAYAEDLESRRSGPVVDVPDVERELVVPRRAALRPFTCAQPVMPGRTSWRRAAPASSGEVLHEQRAGADKAHVAPQHVEQLGQLVEAGAPQQPAQRVRRCVVGQQLAVRSRSSVMVRNFTISNGTPPRPGRCLAEQHRCSHPQPHGRATTASTGDSSTSSTAAPTMSMARFAHSRRVPLGTEPARGRRAQRIAEAQPARRRGSSARRRAGVGLRVPHVARAGPRRGRRSAACR